MQVDGGGIRKILIADKIPGSEVSNLILMCLTVSAMLVFFYLLFDQTQVNVIHQKCVIMVSFSKSSLNT